MPRLSSARRSNCLRSAPLLAIVVGLFVVTAVLTGLIRPVTGGAATGTPEISALTPFPAVGGATERAATARPTAAAPAAGAATPARSGTPDRATYAQAAALAVQYTFPAADDVEVDAHAIVYVQFSRPAALLSALEQRPNRQVLAFDPPLTGSGKWLTSALYTFTPADPGLAPDTTYTVQVSPDLSDLPGTTLAQPYSWSFTTIAPAVADVSPRDNTKFVDPGTAIQVLFNQPMDRASGAAAFSLTSDGAPVAGAISWTDDQTLVFQSSASLPRGATLTASVAVGARGAGSRGSGTRKAQTWSFTVSPLPRVERTTPSDGDTAAQTYGVSITFTAPMEHASTEAAITLEPAPDPDHLPTFYWNGDTTVSISYAFEPSSSYRISVGAGAKDRYGTPIVAPYTFAFTTAAPPPPPSGGRLLTGGQGTLSAYLPVTFTAASVNLTQLDFALYAIPLDEFRDAIWIRYPRIQQTPSNAPLRTWSVPVSDAQQNAEVQTQVTVGDRLPLGGTLAPGFYLLDLKDAGGRQQDRVTFEVTRTSVVVKRGADDALVWAVDLKDGSPVAGVPVTLTDRDGVVQATGTTADDGTLHSAAPRDVQGDHTIYASLARPDDVALATQNWTGSASPYSFDVPVSLYPPVSERGYLYTDRPIYRAGETVHLRFVLRTDDDGNYSVPSDLGDVSLQVTDSRGRNVGSQTLQLDGYGSLGADVQLPDDGATGSYSIALRSNDTFLGSGSFLVAEFRVPEFSVKLDSDRPSYVSGASIGAMAQADFFFGAHLADADLSWQVNARPYSYYPSDRQFAGYSFGDYDYTRKRPEPKNPVASGTGRTDTQGSVSFSVPADLGDYPASERFTITATITDQTRQQISTSKEVIVHRAAYYAGIKTEEYLTAAGKPLAVDLVTVDTSGQAAGGLPLQVSAYLRTWDTKTVRQPDGSVKVVSTVQDTLVDSRSISTDATGRAQFSFTPSKGGEYKIVVAGRDATGNPFQSSTFAYVTSTDFVPWRVENDIKLKLIADRAEYNPGDVAHVLVPAPFAGATGLVTVERGRILTSSVQSFATNSTVVDVPITGDMAPTVYISVTLLKPGGANDVPQYRVGYVKLPVSPAGHALNVTLTPDRTKLGPADTVNVEVTTADAAGNPVPAELSMALVDEAVLSLADERGKPIFPSFWSERPLGVAGGGTMGISINSENEARKAADQRRQSAAARPTAAPPPPPPPTARPAAAAAPAATVTVRTEFKNTAFWQADVQTDANGKATVAIKLPDNLTTWRIDTRGTTVDTSVGDAHATILTQRDIVVRPVAPRFFTAGDQTHLEALVTNRTDAPLDVDVTLSADGLSVSGTTQRITVPPGRSAGAGWDTAATEGPPVKLTFTATAATGQGDAVQLTLPVNPRSTPETVGSSGIVTDQPVQETVQIPGFARQDKGSIEVAVNASLVGVLQQARIVLEAWKYEPADVTAARLLSRVGAWKAAVALAQPLDVQTAHSATATAAIGRLQAMQTGSGAWCWWQPCYFPSAEITARVLYALGVAREAGFTVDSNVLSRAVTYLGGQYDRASDVAYQPNPNARAFWLLAMSQAGIGDRGRDDALAAQRTRLGGSGKGALLDALLLDGADPNDPEVRGLAGDIASSGIYSAAGSHWEDQDEQHPGYANSTESTSLVLLALLRLDPTQPLLDGALRWLTNSRSEGYWRSTRETAVAIDAVADFVAAREQPLAGTSFTVDLNGIRIGQGDFSTDDPGATLQVATPLGGLPTDMPLPITIARQGAGQLYYSLYLRYFAPTDEVSALSNGITVSHELLPEDGDTPVSTVKAGDLVRVRITVAAPSDLQFVQVDDFLPSGLEAIDSSLKTTDPNLVQRQQQELQQLQLPQNQPGGRGASSPFYRWYYFNPFDHVEVRDDRVSLFATRLTRGVHEYVYYARATAAGTFLQPPVVAQETDFPDIFGRSDSTTLVVTP